MKMLAVVVSAVLSLVAFATAAGAGAGSASGSDQAGTSRVVLPATFKPPQVFKNANLVHIISVEKNYVKESVNVVVENVDKAEQDEYYLAFSADEMSRLGGLEVKDRKDTTIGPFTAEIVEYDPQSDTQYYRIRLPTPLKSGGQQTLGITYYYLKAYVPLPASISQDDVQFLSYTFSALYPSAYATSKQKTEVKFPSATIPDYTRLPGNDEIAEFPQKQGSKLTYGPYDEKPAGAAEPVAVRFEFNKPVLHMSELERDVEVSHWGGNVAFEERYTLFHRGANLSALFSRLKYAQSSYYNPTSHALREIRLPLHAGSADAYFTDAIGNVSTSHFRSNRREALLEARPRYPLFGGWKYPFTIGWNSDAKNFLRKTAAGGYVLSVPFFEGPKQAEGVEYEKVQIRIILPEGAENVKYYSTVPEASITEASVELHKTYLDTVGRTTLIIKAQNLVDDFRERELIVTYDYPLMASFRKPLVIFGSMMAVLAGAWAIGNVELRFLSKN